ncbi:unnamed protein product [Ectocarpus sp. 12 AP-2014]
MDAGLGGRGGSSNMVMGAVRKQHMNIALWFGFFTASFVVFYLFSDGDFSFLMTFASFTRGFGFAVLLGLMLAKKHARGVSMKSLQLYAVVFASRLVSVLQHEGYLPYDRSGDFVYHGAEIASLALAVGCVVLMSTKFKSTYQQDVDSFGALHVPTEWGTLYIFVPCLLLAIVMHPNLNKNFLSDTAWTFSMYLESMAIVPQLFMFQKQAKGIVEVLVTHSTFALGLARVLDMVFWMFSYKELTHAGSNSVGMFVLFSQFVHVVIMGDFFYYYAISVKTGNMMQLPSQLSGMV